MRLAACMLFVLCSTARAAETLPLFNGESLLGWQTDDGAFWYVEEGAIVASGSGDGFLSTLKTYGDFYLKVEFLVDATTNSGAFIRCRDRERIHPETCYELNIWDEHPKQEARTGAIVMHVMPPLAQVQTVGQWSTLEVMARGGRIEVKVNGELTAALDDADATPGFIALQHWEKGTVRFRAVEILNF